MNIYAFADEASPLIAGQIAAMKRNGLNGLEIRNVDGQNVSDITVQKAAEVKKMLDDAGLQCWSIGSPIGKIGVNDPFEPHLDKLKNTLDVAGALNAGNIRMFSFYIPAGENPANWRNLVFDRMAKMLEIAGQYPVALCHENEKGIYGDLAVRCKELVDAFPALHNVFDPANYIQCGQETLQAWEMLKSRTKYFHVKDALQNGQVVPAGHGIGHVGEILKDYIALGGQNITVEPHLKVFEGFSALEKGNVSMGDFTYESSDIAFDTACNAAKALL